MQRPVFSQKFKSDDGSSNMTPSFKRKHKYVTPSSWMKIKSCVFWYQGGILDLAEAMGRDMQHLLGSIRGCGHMEEPGTEPAGK